MSSEGAVAAAEPRSHRLYAWFDHEAAAVVTILLGLFQVLLSVPLAYANQTLPRFFILPLVLGVLIVTGGSFAFANERNSSRLLRRGCACSNVVGLVGALLAFCLYCHSLSIVSNPEECTVYDRHNRWSGYECPEALLVAYCWCLILLLLLYDIGAVVLHCFLTVSALKALKTD